MLYFFDNRHFKGNKLFSLAKRLFVLILLVFVFPLPFTHASQSIPSLSIKEQRWLAAHKTIRIAYDGAFAPYSFINENDQLEGIAVDFMALLSQRLGIQFVTSPKSNWNDLYKAVANHRIDVVATMVDRPDRRLWFNFTKPYLTKSLVIVTQKANDTIKDREDIANKSVALSKDYEYTGRVLKEFPSIKPTQVKDMKDGFAAVEAGTVDAAITFMATTNYLQLKYPFPSLKVAGFYERNSANESIAVRGDWQILATILEKALDALTEEEKQLIFAKWMPETQPVQATTAPATIAEPHPAPAVLASPDSFNTTYAALGLGSFGLFAPWFLRTNRQRQKKISQLKAEAITANSQVEILQNDLEQLLAERSVDFNSTEHKFRSLLENLRYEYFFYQQNIQGEFTYVSPSVSTVLGYSADDFAENFQSYLTDNPINQKLKNQWPTPVPALPTPAYELEVFDAKQAIRWLEIIDKPIYDDYGNCTGVDGFVHDITVRKQLELHERCINQDFFSEGQISIVSQELFTDRAQQAIHWSQRHNTVFALIYLQLDEPDPEQDGLDKITQPSLSKEITKAILAKLRKSDTATQLGASKLLLVLPETDGENANLVAKKIMLKLASVYEISGDRQVLPINMGISVYPQHGIDIKKLIHQAEIAMMFAKNEKFGIAVYSEYM